MNVLGIDPGLVNTGYGIISSINNNFELIDYGVIKTNSKDKLSNRLKIIFNEVSQLINKYNPKVLSIEEIFYSKNVKSSLLLGHARGVAMAAASVNEMLVYEFAARKVKQSLTGNGNAHKDQVRFMVKNLLKMNEAPKSEDASDALGIALCYMFQNKLEHL
ncbi:MAG: crossover junction endodeoxyribonuclease RuvC [bacterium TMED6]|nr:MAG: crossover junction endodeoxyribonuclease RuvC [bacterium TMED6]